MALTLAQLDQGISALLRNSQALIAEASALLQHQSFARAYALSHLAREELSKVSMLRAAGIKILAEQQVDWKRLMVRLRDHKAKLRLEQFDLWLLGVGLADSRNQQVPVPTPEDIDKRNDLKNASLYVGFSQGRFVPPSEVISELKARRNVRVAELRQKQVHLVEAMLRPLATQTIGSLSGTPAFDQLSEIEMVAASRQAARFYASLVKASQPGEGDS